MWEEIKENYKLNFITCIIFFIIGCLNLLMNYKMCRFFQLANMVIALIPFLLSILLLILFYNIEFKANIRITISIIMIVLYSILLIFNFAILLESEIFDTNTDINNYPRSIRLGGNSDEMQHFPKKIPENAKNIEFEEWAPFMQGGFGMYLSYDIDEEEEEKLDNEFRVKSKYMFETMDDIKGAGENICLNSKMSEAIGSNFNTENSDRFRLYILGATKLSGDVYWNHGIEYGVIINRDQHRIIYFVEHW